MTKNTFSILTISIIFLLTLLCFPAWAIKKEVEVDNVVVTELRYLLSFVGSDNPDPQRFDSQRIENVLNFITGPKDEKVLYHGGSFEGCPSAYHEFDIYRDLAYILRLAYNPDIPSVVTSPASLRMSRWIEFEGEQEGSPNLSGLLTNLESPLIFNGIEHMVNSPDTFSGA